MKLTDIDTVRELVESGYAKQLRLTLGLSLRATARALGTSPSTLSRWESRQRRINNSGPWQAYGELIVEWERLLRDSLAATDV